MNFKLGLIEIEFKNKFGFRERTKDKGEFRGKILLFEKITAWLQVRCSRSAHLTQPCCDFFINMW
jgi:hypothetical protein